MNRLAAVLVSCLAVAGCSGSGGSGSSSSNNNGDASSLQVVTPMTIFSKSGESGVGYVVVKNPTNVAVSNLHYDLSTLVGGAIGAAIESASAANCAVVESMSQCNVKVMIPAGAVAGSFGFSANNGSSLLSKLGKAFKDSVTQPATQAIAVQQAAYNNYPGAEGITLSYSKTVIDGVPYVLVTGLVASANAGNFNGIVLVDDAGTPIPNQELLGGAVSNAQGTTFQVLLPAPANGASQTIKVQTQQDGVAVSTEASSDFLYTRSQIGIVNTLPNAVYLTKENPEQIVTFSNTGDRVAQLQSWLTTQSNIEVIFGSAPLNIGETITATLKLINPNVSAPTGDILLTYNNGQREVRETAKVTQNVNPTPTPSPSPTPTPTPGPGPSPSPAPLITITDLTGTSSSMMGTTPITFAATITGTGSATLTAALANSVTGTIVSDPSPCDLTVGGTSSCTFSIIPWYTGFDNSTVNLINFDPFTPTGTEITLSATNSATIAGDDVTSNTISYTITTPYVYLAAPVLGAASATNTGITWGSGGTISNRFTAGSQSGGGTCNDSLKDNLTGLEWVKAPDSTNQYTWANAKAKQPASGAAIPETLCGYTVS